MIAFLLATRNAHKVRELRRLLGGASVRLLTLRDFPGIPAVKEDGATFEANAVKKAVETSRHTLLPVLAEDSGLEVRALGGRPGVRSARFAGPARSDRANNSKLLRMLGRTPDSRRCAEARGGASASASRQARFVCVMALAVGGRPARTFRGSCAGSIARQPAGKRGFGYDPVFVPRGRRVTMAQLSAGEKGRISHRGRAARRLAAWLRRGL